MRHLRLVSIAITAFGLLLTIASAAAGLGATWALIGLMLTVAGGIKLLIVLLWRVVGNFGPTAAEDQPITSHHS